MTSSPIRRRLQPRLQPSPDSSLIIGKLRAEHQLQQQQEQQQQEQQQEQEQEQQ